MDIIRDSGFIIRMGDSEVKSLNLPDWSLDYIEFQEGEMPRYRQALIRERKQIVKVFPTRIYFSQVD